MTQVDRFANVDDGAMFVFVEIDAGLLGQVFEEFLDMFGGFVGHMWDVRRICRDRSQVPASEGLGSFRG